MTEPQTFREYYKYYLTLHQNKTCRRLHACGQLTTLATIAYAISSQTWLLLLIVLKVDLIALLTDRFVAAQSSRNQDESRWLTAYQQLFEDELSAQFKDSVQLPSHFFDLTSAQRLMIETLIDLGYKRAVEDALDPEVLAETSSLSAEMASQLYNFANIINGYLGEQDNSDLVSQDEE